jgi:hypothetical protein
LQAWCAGERDSAKNAWVKLILLKRLARPFLHHYHMPIAMWGNAISSERMLCRATGRELHRDHVKLGHDLEDDIYDAVVAE